MASVPDGTVARPRQWWKHLREFKKDFWKRERVQQKKHIKESTPVDNQTKD